MSSDDDGTHFVYDGDLSFRTCDDCNARRKTYTYNKTIKNVTIHESVTVIKSESFKGCTSLETVVVPDTVETIDKWAFSECTALASVTLGNGVKSIELAAFDSCTSLLAIDIPDAVESIKAHAFRGCTALASASLGNGVKFIRSNSFDSCTSLPAIDIPDTVESIEECAFFGCTALASVTLGNGVKSIEWSAFESCTSLPAIDIPGTVKTIEKETFCGCSALASVTHGNGVTSIGKEAFARCTSLPAIDIPNTVETIAENAFNRCTVLASASLGNGVKSIGKRAFGNCTSLSVAMIPESVGELGDDAFEGCNLDPACLERYQHMRAPVVYDGSKSFDDNKTITNVTVHESVTAIRNHGSWTKVGAFKGCTSLPAIDIPGNVKCIEKETFFGCTALASVTLRHGVKSIGKWAFYECTNLLAIDIPDTVESIEQKTFLGCTALASITLGNGVKSIGEEAFHGCIALASVTLGNGIKSIGKGAFSGCTSLTAIDVPDTVETIAEKAFHRCTVLASVTLGNGVTSIGEEAFARCTSLPAIDIPNTVETIKRLAFNRCTVLASASLGNGVKSIGEFAFNECTALASVTLGNGVKSIGKYAFIGCTSLPAIDIPDTVDTIQGGAFRNCTSLSVAMIPESVFELGNDVFEGCNLDPACLERYQRARTQVVYDGRPFRGNETFTNGTIHKSMTFIKWDAFLDCTSLETVVVPGTVETIRENAFSGCTALASVTLGNGIKSIGGAFSGCTALLAIDIPGSVETIETRAFSECTALASVTLRNGLKSIGGGQDSGAFGGCTALLSIDIPGTVETIAGGAFRECTALASVTLGNGLKTIGGNRFYYNSGAFSGCTALLAIVIPETVETIEEYAFSGCTALASVTLGCGVKSIEGEAFSGCTNLLAIVIPDTVETIKRVFEGCTALASVTLGNGVKSIWRGAFYGCSNLLAIDIPDTVETIEKGAFEGCTALASVTLGNGVKSFWEYAFESCPCEVAVGWREETVERPDADTEAVVFRDGVAEISGFAFYKCAKLRVVAVADTVNSIGHMAFAGCSELSSVDIPPSVTTVAVSAFNGCQLDDASRDRLLQFWVYDGTQSFTGNTTITTVTIHESVTVIKNSAFSGCSNLLTVDIPDTVETIERGAFEECTALASVTLGNGVKSIESRAFFGCTSLSTIRSVSSHGCSLPALTVPRGVSRIEECIFIDCALTSAHLHDGIIEFVDCGTAFYGCKSLAWVQLPNNDKIKFAFYGCFSGCESLIAITVPVTMKEGVSFTGEDSNFYGCSALEKVVTLWNERRMEVYGIDGDGDDGGGDRDDSERRYGHCDSDSDDGNRPSDDGNRPGADAPLTLADFLCEYRFTSMMHFLQPNEGDFEILQPVHQACLKADLTLQQLKDAIATELTGTRTSVRGSEAVTCASLLSAPEPFTGLTPLHFACLNPTTTLEVLQHLIQWDPGAVVVKDSEDKVPLQRALQVNHSASVLQCLFACHQADDPRLEDLALPCLLDCSALQKVVILWNERRATVDASPATASALMVELNTLELLDFLCKYRFTSVMHFLQPEGDFEILQPVHQACTKTDLTLQQLEDAIATDLIGTRTREGSSETVACASLLSAPEPFTGLTPLHFACLNPTTTLEVMQHLVQWDSSAAMVKDFEGRLPLHLVCATAIMTLGMVQCLAQWDSHDAALKKDSKDRTPLHLACLNPSATLEVVQHLILWDPSAVVAKDADDKVPLQLALQVDQPVQILQHLFARHQFDDPRIGPLALPCLLDLHLNPPNSLAGPDAFHRALQHGWVTFVSSSDILKRTLEGDVDALYTPTALGLDQDLKEKLCADSLIAVCTHVIKHCGRDVAMVLANSKDFEGREAIVYAVPAIKAALQERLDFLGRYQFVSTTPEHKSATCIVLKAVDKKAEDDYREYFRSKALDSPGINNSTTASVGEDAFKEIAEEMGFQCDAVLFKQLDIDGSGTISEDEFLQFAKNKLDHGGPRHVAIKLMKDRSQFQRELASRDDYKLEPKYVMAVICTYGNGQNLEDDREFVVDLERENLGSYKYGIVMAYADRNLDTIFRSERPDSHTVRTFGRQIAEAISHVHEKGLIHGDMKLLNIVRYRHRLRLIDMDACVQISDSQTKSYAGAKISSGVLPPEVPPIPPPHPHACTLSSLHSLHSTFLYPKSLVPHSV
jgi:ankyrin repeat protein